MQSMPNITWILDEIERGEPEAADQLLPLVYDELRALATAKLAQEHPGQTLQATALVHEAYLRLLPRQHSKEEQHQHWNSRRHFFGAAAEAMRRILVENARRNQQIKRGGRYRRVCNVDIEVPAGISAEDVLAVDEALDLLATVDAQVAQVVKLHFFAGLSFDDVAAQLGISTRTAYRDWNFARAWLARRLGAGDRSASG